MGCIFFNDPYGPKKTNRVEKLEVTQQKEHISINNFAKSQIKTANNRGFLYCVIYRLIGKQRA